MISKFRRNKTPMQTALLLQQSVILGEYKFSFDIYFALDFSPLVHCLIISNIFQGGPLRKHHLEHWGSFFSPHWWLIKIFLLVPSPPSLQAGTDAGDIIKGNRLKSTDTPKMFTTQSRLFIIEYAVKCFSQFV